MVPCSNMFFLESGSPSFLSLVGCLAFCSENRQPSLPGSSRRRPDLFLVDKVVHCFSLSLFCFCYYLFFLCFEFGLCTVSCFVVYAFLVYWWLLYCPLDLLSGLVRRFSSWFAVGSFFAAGVLAASWLFCCVGC